MSKHLRFEIGPNGEATKITDSEGNAPILGIGAISISVAGGEPTRAMMLVEVNAATAEVEGGNVEWTVLLGGEPVRLAKITLADGRVIDFSSGVPSISQ